MTTHENKAAVPRWQKDSQNESENSGVVQDSCQIPESLISPQSPCCPQWEEPELTHKWQRLRRLLWFRRSQLHLWHRTECKSKELSREGFQKEVRFQSVLEERSVSLPYCSQKAEGFRWKNSYVSCQDSGLKRTSHCSIPKQCPWLRRKEGGQCLAENSK